MYICIAGKNNIAVDCLRYLLSQNLFSKDKILVCYNTTDKGKDTFQKSFKKYCQQLDFQEVVIADLLDRKELIFISLEFDKIIPTKKFISSKLYNIHFSLLPKYKGMYTSVWPILNGETQSGVTLHKIDEGIDTGDIVDQTKFKIGLDENCRDLYLKYIHYGTILFKKNITDLVTDKITSRQQPATASYYYSKKSIDYSNLKINLYKTAFEIKNRIRAFNFREYQVPKVFGFGIVACDILDKRSRQKPGTILQEHESYLDISTIDYDLRLIKDMS